jgi:hypothetical protein
MKEQHCQACGTAILWVYTERGARMPVDAAPTADGNIQVVADKCYVIPKTRLEALSDDDKAGLRKSHFATCPEAERFKSKRAVSKAA